LSERNVDRARREHAGGDFGAALIFAEQALTNAADAVLARDGVAVNSHVARFSYPALPAIYAEERHLIDQIRSSPIRPKLVETSILQSARPPSRRALLSVQAIIGI
jgi:hypothetical protein